MQGDKRQWNGRTDGTQWMQKSLVVMFRFINLRILYGVMSLVIPFYLIFNPPGYKAIYRYFRYRHKWSALKSFFHTYYNHYTFGKVILDRFASYAGKKFDVEIEGNELFLQLADGDQGFLILSSHVGNYELAGYLLKSNKKKFNALVYAGESETVMENRRKKFDAHNVNMIPVMNDMSHLFVINNALVNGEIVSIPSDRLFGSPKGIDCNFFDAEATFPLGPFAIATQRDVPAVAIFVMKESVKRYRIYVRKIELTEEEQASAGRKQKMSLMAQHFVTEMESVLKKHPDQWFNYFEFWKS